MSKCQKLKWKRFEFLSRIKKDLKIEKPRGVRLRAIEFRYRRLVDKRPQCAIVRLHESIVMATIPGKVKMKEE